MILKLDYLQLDYLAILNKYNFNPNPNDKAFVHVNVLRVLKFEG